MAKKKDEGELEPETVEINGEGIKCDRITWKVNVDKALLEETKHTYFNAYFDALNEALEKGYILGDAVPMASQSAMNITSLYLAYKQQREDREKKELAELNEAPKLQS